MSRYGYEASWSADHRLGTGLALPERKVCVTNEYTVKMHALRDMYRGE